MCLCVLRVGRCKLGEGRTFIKFDVRDLLCFGFPSTYVYIPYVNVKLVVPLPIHLPAYFYLYFPYQRLALFTLYPLHPLPSTSTSTSTPTANYLDL